MIATVLVSAAAAATFTTAIVAQDQAVLRAAPKDSARQHAVLRQGEAVEIRGERLDYLQVYDHKRERAGFVRASQVRRTNLSAAEAPGMLAVLRFVKDDPGSEALGIGLAAAWLKAAPAAELRGENGADAFDALGTMAERLARRASSGTPRGTAAERTVAAHLEVASGYGIGFRTYEREGRMEICYDGEAFRRVLAMPARPAQQAAAALALTRQECVDPDLQPLQRARTDEWRAEVLDRVEVLQLAGYLKARIHMRRAGVWSAIAWQRTRTGEGDAAAAASRALQELAGVNRAELTDDDQAAYNDAAMRVNASRWAVVPAPAAPARYPAIVTAAGEPGQTCVALVDAKNGIGKPLARRCTYGTVWAASSTLNREGNALALAVQPAPAWRELWVFRKEGGAWTVSVLPPSETAPELGYAEFAGWVPGGRQMLVAREARGEGKYRRSYEVMGIDSLAPQRQSSDAASLGPFQRWQDPGWKRMTVSLR